MYKNEIAQYLQNHKQKSWRFWKFHKYSKIKKSYSSEKKSFHFLLTSIKETAKTKYLRNIQMSSLTLRHSLSFRIFEPNFPKRCVSAHVHMLIFKGLLECFSFYGSRHARNFRFWYVSPLDKWWWPVKLFLDNIDVIKISYFFSKTPSHAM